MIERNTVQVISALVALVGVVIYLRLARKYPRYGLYILVPALYLMLVFMFYVTVLLSDLRVITTTFAMGDLSAWLRLVSTLLWIGFGLLLSLESAQHGR